MTRLANTSPDAMPETGCCPPFDPAPWDGAQVTWHDKPFVKDHVACLFHVPLNLGRKVRKDMALIEAAGARTERQPLMLADAASPWGTEIFIEVSRAVPGATTDGLTGTFLTKAFEGPFGEAGAWAREMEEYVRSKGHVIQKLYFGYTTCPRCAKAYGKNYVVLFARVDAPGRVAATAPQALGAAS
jgi:hypothetical protein